MNLYLDQIIAPLNIALSKIIFRYYVGYGNFNREFFQGALRQMTNTIEEISYVSNLASKISLSDEESI